MDLQAFLRMLHVDHGPSGSGEYMCRCPAHDDRTASLCVNQGEKGIVIKCQAGCSAQAICEALGIKIRDLFMAQKTGATQGSQSKPNIPELKEARPTTRAQGPGKYVCHYTYRDASGAPVFEVVRYDTENGGKTFRQRRPDPTKKGGYDWKVPEELRTTIYNLPEVFKAIRLGEPVYVVEGEKDADNLAALGYTATTNAGGAGKWVSAHSQHLRGANAIILPDCDDVGQAHGQEVAAQLTGIAKRVRVIDLTRGCATLPGKGDITDLFDILGKIEGCETLRKLVEAAPDWEPSLKDRAIAAYNRVPGYHIDNGCISVPQEEGYRKLATFIAAPRAVIMRDDGVTTEKIFLIEGWSMSGAQLSSIRVPAAKFAGMNWVGENWDFAANIMPGATTKDKLRYVIAEVGNKLARHITEYTHTGWRKIDGKWAFLYHGGAIGCENVNVDLWRGISRYCLDGAADVPADEACIMSFALRTVIADHVSIPLLGMMYLAPLQEFLAAAGQAPAFSLFLLGTTGTRKSTAAALALSHFGNFDSRSLPASFNDTANSVRAKAFQLKDMPIVVDDYHPETSIQERKRMDTTAQSLSRAFGDNAERGRLKSDLNLQEAKPPRGVAILSGEDTPGIGSSGIARYFIVQMTKNDVPATEELTDMQDGAKAGVLRRAMRGYIEWLLPQVDELPGKLSNMFRDLRRRAISQGKGTHGRMPEATAHIMLGYEMMLEYMQSEGVFSADIVKKEIEHAWRVVGASSAKQDTEMQEEKPSKLFVGALSELMAAKIAGVCDMTNKERQVPSKGMIGYLDERHYYLLPEVAYTMVTKLYGDRGQTFPLSYRMLYRQMREEGMVVWDEIANRSTRPKSIDGKTRRFLWVIREAIDGPSSGTEQMAMRYPVDIDPDPPWEEGRE